MTASPVRDRAPAPEEAPRPTLSVVMPVHNGERWIAETVARLETAVREARWPAVELVVVDDGSTDDTVAVVRSLSTPLPVRLVRQENKGRFLARRAGLDAATGDYVFLLDVRVFLHPGALAYLAAQLRAHPERRVWNAHVDIATRGNPFARFWEAVTFAAWRRYFAAPTLTRYTAEDFDHYPKGTGGFLAPRSLLLDAYGAFTSYFDDPTRVSDDTALLRHIAEAEPIHLSPGFRCTYHARHTLRSFLAHASARGVAFVDGHLRRSSRFRWVVPATLAATPVALAALAVAPGWSLAAMAAGCAGAGGLLLVLGAPARSALSFALLLPAFAVVYGTGIWRGVAMAAVTWLRRRRR